MCLPAASRRGLHVPEACLSDERATCFAVMTVECMHAPWNAPTDLRLPPQSMAALSCSRIQRSCDHSLKLCLTAKLPSSAA